MQDDISDPDDDIEPPSPKHPRVEVPPDSFVMDIADFDKKHDMTDHEKYQFITHHFSPDMLYKFQKMLVAEAFSTSGSCDIHG